MSEQQHILISPLGLSPGAVSGAAFALRRGIGQGAERVAYPISRVVTVGTFHPDVMQASRCLAALFREAGIAYQAEFITQEELKQSDDSVADFVTRLGDVFDRCREGQRHVAVTGGRSGMGALAALAASLYGASHLWHLWVPTTIEEKGHISRLPQPYTPENEYLNPATYELVPLPFVDLTPLHGDFWRYYHAEELRVAEQVRPLLAQLLGGKLSLGNLFPGGVSLRDKQQINDWLADYETLPTKAQEERQKEVAAFLQRRGILDRPTQDRLLDVLELRLPLSALLLIAEEEASNHAFWRYLWERRGRIETAVYARQRPLDPETLLQTLSERFDLEETRTLCFNLSIEYDDLKGEGKTARLRELILYLQRRQRVPELIALAAAQRPDAQWWATDGPAINIETEADLFLMRGLRMWLNQRGGREQL